MNRFFWWMRSFSLNLAFYSEASCSSINDWDCVHTGFPECDVYLQMPRCPSDKYLNQYYRKWMQTNSCCQGQPAGPHVFKPDRDSGLREADGRSILPKLQRLWTSSIFLWEWFCLAIKEFKICAFVWVFICPWGNWAQSVSTESRHSMKAQLSLNGFKHKSKKLFLEWWQCITAKETQRAEIRFWFGGVSIPGIKIGLGLGEGEHPELQLQETATSPCGDQAHKVPQTVLLCFAPIVAGA